MQTPLAYSGVGGTCEAPPNPDSDQDGIANPRDNCPAHFNPAQTDSDGDIQGDACDTQLITQQAGVTCGGRTATIEDDANNNTLNGTNGRDVIAGLGGHDIINGRGGPDLICGDDGNDTLRGAGGRDVLIGETGDDNLFGDAGGDRLLGGADNDHLDAVDKVPRNDELNGGAGFDTRRVDVTLRGDPKMMDL